MKRIWVSILGNMIEALCVACNENLHIDGFTDWGMAKEYRTVNLSTPTGKMYTKTFYTSGLVVVK